MFWQRPKYLPLFRLYDPATGDHLYTTSEDERKEKEGAGYVAEPCGCHLLPTGHPDSVPFLRVPDQDNYHPGRVICHVRHELLSSARRRAVQSLILFIFIEVAVALVGVVWGDPMDRPFVRIINAWPVIASAGVIVLVLSGVLIGRERLALLGTPFDHIFRTG
jgi:uncharacterized protein DUF5648